MESKELRRQILINSEKAHACHIGSSLSCVELVLGIVKQGGINIFSKASGAATIYALLGLDAEHLRQNPLCWPGGSLGHGLPIAAGLALAYRRQQIFCLMSDAELDEGTTWESLLFASHNKLENLIIVVDYNKLQSCGSNDNVLTLEPLADKFKAFGCEVRIVDGHNEKMIDKCLSYPRMFRDKPVVVIANTIKGKGVDFMENNYEWHYKNLDKKLLKQALSQL